LVCGRRVRKPRLFWYIISGVFRGITTTRSKQEYGTLYQVSLEESPLLVVNRNYEP